MITFNEEEYLQKALDNVRNYVDEMVIVDHGSTDRTLEIAKKYHAKIFIYQGPVHFARMRNLSIDKASGNWILVLDADETFEPKLLKNLQFFANNNIKADAFAFPRINYLDGKKTDVYPDRQFRFFPKSKEIKYKWAVHEKLIGWKTAVNPNNLHIIHKKSSKRHLERNKQYDKIAKEQSIGISAKLAI